MSKADYQLYEPAIDKWWEDAEKVGTSEAWMKVADYLHGARMLLPLTETEAHDYLSSRYDAAIQKAYLALEKAELF